MRRLRSLPDRLKSLDLTSAKLPLKRADAFYLTADWQRLITHIRASRSAACAHCGRIGTRLFGDHIVELQDGGAALDAANVQLLCSSCHVRKGNRERARRMQRRS